MRPTTTSAIRATSARRAGRCGPRARTRGTQSTARPSARSPAGSGSTGMSPTRPPATSRCARAAGPGMHWSPAIGAEHLATRERAGLFDESSFAKLEIAGPGAAAFLEGSATTASPARSARSPTRRCSTGAAGSSATSPSRRVEEELFSIVTGTAFGNHDLSWIRRHAPADGSVRCTDVTARWACFALWGPRVARHPRAAHRRSAGLPLHAHARARGRRRARAGAARDVRRRARLGAVLPDRVRRRACGGRCGSAGREHGLVAGGYRAIDSMRLEKGYRVWAADITPDETPLRGRAGLLREAGGRLPRRGGARRSGPRAAAARRAAPALPGARGSALGGARQRARALDGEVLGRVTAAATATRSSARSPTPTCRPRSSLGTNVEVDIFGRWVSGEVAGEPLFDPKSERVRVS